MSHSSSSERIDFFCSGVAIIRVCHGLGGCRGHSGSLRAMTLHSNEIEKSVGMPLGPGVDDIEHARRRFGRDEAECFLQYRADDGMQAVLDEGVVVGLGL